MEPRQKKRLAHRFGPPRPGVRVICLDIPDRYEFMDSTLVSAIRS